MNTVEMASGIAHQLSNGMSQQHRPLINLNLSSIRSGSLCNRIFFWIDLMRPDWKVHTRWKQILMSLELSGNWNHTVGERKKKQYPKLPHKQLLKS